MENKELIEIFGSILKASRDSGLDVLTSFKEQKPKNPLDEQKSLIDLMESLNPKQQLELQKSIQYCIELSLFKFINTLEFGVSEYSFDLDIKDSNSTFSLINDEVDNGVSENFWDWID